MAVLLRLLPLMARSAKAPGLHKRELIEDLKQNRAGDALRAYIEYLDYIAADRDFAAELAASGSRVGRPRREGGRRPHRRPARHARSGSHVTLVTIPGAVFLLPDEAPQETAAAIAGAVSQVP